MSFLRRHRRETKIRDKSDSASLRTILRFYGVQTREVEKIDEHSFVRAPDLPCLLQFGLGDGRVCCYVSRLEPPVDPSPVIILEIKVGSP